MARADSGQFGQFVDSFKPGPKNSPFTIGIWIFVVRFGQFGPDSNKKKRSTFFSSLIFETVQLSKICSRARDLLKIETVHKLSKVSRVASRHRNSAQIETVQKPALFSNQERNLAVQNRAFFKINQKSRSAEAHFSPENHAKNFVCHRGFGWDQGATLLCSRFFCQNRKELRRARINPRHR